MLDLLLGFFPLPSYHNVVLLCLKRVVTRDIRAFDKHLYVELYNALIMHLHTILPPSADIPEAYASGSSEARAFIVNLALILTSFYKFHMMVLETSKYNGITSALLQGLEYLINISYVDDTDISKICFEYWNSFIVELSAEVPIDLRNSEFSSSIMVQRKMPMPMSWPSDLVHCSVSQLLQLRQLYAKLRLLIISRMTMPENKNDFLIKYKGLHEFFGASLNDQSQGEKNLQAKI